MAGDAWQHLGATKGWLYLLRGLVVLQFPDVPWQTQVLGDVSCNLGRKTLIAPRGDRDQASVAFNDGARKCAALLVVFPSVASARRLTRNLRERCRERKQKQRL